MNEALVFIAIMIATILKGILGALLVVPLLATVVVIAGYIQRRVLGLPPFADDGSQQFVSSADEVQVPRRKWSKKERRERLAKGARSDSPPADATLMSESPPDELSAREK